MSALKCRAVLLLEKELSRLKKMDLWGIDVDVIDDNMFNWKVTLSGLKDTAWEGSCFEILICFTEDYNLTPPSVSFQTIPMHPNVDNVSGMVCLDCLTEWNQKFSMSYVLLSLQQMLSEPSLNSPINEEAAMRVVTTPNHYKQIVLDSVLSSQKEKSREGKSTRASPTLNDNSPISNTLEGLKENKPTRSTTRSKVSYEEYLNLWKTIGTTHTGLDNKITINKSEGCDKVGGILDEDMFAQISTSDILMYDTSFSDEKHKRQCKLNQLNSGQIQMSKDAHSRRKSADTLLTKSPVEAIDEDVEIDLNEANSLLSWTENLPTD